jgi:serine/threonine protein kinase
MTLVANTKVGAYETLAPIGAGGMGEVYRARDTRLGRDVALKILPESFTDESDRLRRFEQDARAVAALNHPNILAVFDIGQRNGSPFLVSELLEGESLRAVIERGIRKTTYVIISWFMLRVIVEAVIRFIRDRDVIRFLRAGLLSAEARTFSRPLCKSLATTERGACWLTYDVYSGAHNAFLIR